MFMNGLSKKNKLPGYRAQAMVEFAIVAPILFALLIGVFEFGRMVFIYAAATNASREAVRFGSVIGYDDDGFHKYRHCEGIRNMAQRSAYFLNLQTADIVIEYDHGPGTSSFVVCDAASGEDANVVVNSGTNQDRIMVTITAQYSPFTRLFPVSSRTFVSSSARTILGYVEIESNTPVATSTPIITVPSDTPTATMPSDTPTATPSNTPDTGPVYTLTPLPSNTPTPEPSDTPTATPSPSNTPTPEPSNTPTETVEPSGTPTPTQTEPQP